MLLDALEHLDENKNYVKHQKYLFPIELISKKRKYPNESLVIDYILLKYFLDIIYVHTYQLHLKKLIPFDYAVIHKVVVEKQLTLVEISTQL